VQPRALPAKIAALGPNLLLIAAAFRGAGQQPARRDDRPRVLAVADGSCVVERFDFEAE
jgi:hypothetical protein